MSEATPPTPPTPPWYEGKVDAETIGWLQTKGWDKDPVTAAVEASKARREAERFLGHSPEHLLKLPKDATDEAGWSAVRQRLGMPKEAKEYDLSAVKFADGRELDAALTDTMRAALHKAGVAKDAAPDVVKSVVKYLGDADASKSSQRAANLQTERSSLQKEWGTNFEFNKLTAMQGAKRLGVDETTVAKLEGEVGYSKVMEMFRKIGAGTNEDTFVQGGRDGNPTTMSGAKSKLEALKADPEWVGRYLKGMPKEVAEFNNLIILTTGAAA